MNIIYVYVYKCVCVRARARLWSYLPIWDDYSALTVIKTGSYKCLTIFVTFGKVNKIVGTKSLINPKIGELLAWHTAVTLLPTELPPPVQYLTLNLGFTWFGFT